MFVDGSVPVEALALWGRRVVRAAFQRDLATPSYMEFGLNLLCRFETSVAHSTHKAGWDAKHTPEPLQSTIAGHFKTPKPLNRAVVVMPYSLPCMPAIYVCHVGMPAMYVCMPF